MLDLAGIEISFDISIVIIMEAYILIKVGKLDKRIKKLENGKIPEKAHKRVLKVIQHLMSMLLSK